MSLQRDVMRFWFHRDFTTNVGPVMSEAAKSRGIPASQVLREVMSVGSDEIGRAHV